MNSSEFVKAVAEHNGISTKQAYKAIVAVMDTLRILISNGEKIKIGGFGTFEVSYFTKGKWTIAFKNGRTLKRVVNTRNIYK